MGNLINQPRFLREERLARDHGILGPNDISEIWLAVAEARVNNSGHDQESARAFDQALWASPAWRQLVINDYSD